MDELKPCPFCGKMPELDSFNHMVSCKNAYCACQPQTWYLRDDDEAVEKWNRRADNE